MKKSIIIDEDSERKGPNETAKDDEGKSSEEGEEDDEIRGMEDEEEQVNRSEDQSRYSKRGDGLGNKAKILPDLETSEWTS